jgi:hypothetical protein
MDPPPLSTKVIKNLGEKFCKMAPSELSHSSLMPRGPPTKLSVLGRQWCQEERPRMQAARSPKMTPMTRKIKRMARSKGKWQSENHEWLDTLKNKSFCVNVSMFMSLNFCYVMLEQWLNVWSSINEVSLQIISVFDTHLVLFELIGIHCVVGLSSSLLLDTRKKLYLDLHFLVLLQRYYWDFWG